MSQDLAIALALFLLLVVCPCLGLVPPLDRFATRQWAARQQLPVRGADRVWIRRQRAARSLSLAGGALVGLLTTVPARFFAPALAEPPLQVWSWVVFAITGGAVGLAVHGLRISWPRADQTLRVAHSTAPHLTDSISPAGLLTTRLLAGLAAASALLSGLLPVWRGPGFGPDESGPVWVGLGVVLAGWVFAEVLSRKIRDRPQPAGDLLDLAWSDAARSEQIRDAFSIPTSLSIVAAGLAALPLESASPAPAWTTGPMLALLAILGVTMVTALTLTAVSVLPVGSPRRAAVLAAAREG